MLLNIFRKFFYERATSLLKLNQMTYYYIYYINKYIFYYLHHRRRKPRCSLAQIPRCTLILIDVHRTFTPRSLYTCSSKTEAQSCDSRAFLRLFPSMSLIRIHPKAASCTDTLKGNPSKVSFNVVFRSCPLFLATTLKSLLLTRSFYSVNWRKSILLS